MAVRETKRIRKSASLRCVFFASVVNFRFE